MLARDKVGVGGEKAAIEAMFQKMTDRLLAGEVLNPTHLFWRQFIGSEVNIVKRELVFINPLNIPDYYSLLENCSRFGVLNKRDFLYDVSNTEILDVSAHTRLAIIKKFSS